MLGLLLFTDLTSQTGLANHLGVDYSMLIVHGVSRAQLRKVLSNGDIETYNKCRAMAERSEYPPLRIVYDPYEGGEINGWAVVDPARNFMDSKTRNCSVGTCDFVGNYYQLTEHASCVHPGVRPTDVDPERELEWRRLEEDMVQQDLLSMQLESDHAAEVIVGDVTRIWHLWYSMPDSSSSDESDSDS
ncbi:hypothetical protein HanRHA438_Chr05g0225401 [Helianthus annuus]|nr:hypothetical protein HanRHA438_Chr05g0225401 [Helianthus annuus]